MTMEIFHVLLDYLLERGLLDSYKIPILEVKQSEILNSKWPWFVNLVRIQFIVVLAQLLTDLAYNINLDQLSIAQQLSEILIAFVIIILDCHLLERLSTKAKFTVIILLLVIESVYITMAAYYLRFNQFSEQDDNGVHIFYLVLVDILLITIQPLFIGKLLIFILQYTLLAINFSFNKHNFSYHILIIVLYLFYIYQQETKFRKLLQNAVIPQEILDSLQIPVFLMKTNSLDIVIYNEVFTDFLSQSLTQTNACSPIMGVGMGVKEFFQQFFTQYDASKPIQDVENCVDALNLHEVLQIIKAKGQKWRKEVGGVRMQFSVGECPVKFFDIKIQFGIQYNNSDCFLVSMSDISAIIEKTQLFERTNFKSRLIKSLSHELRTKKNIVQGLLKMHLDQFDDKSDLIKQAYNNSKIESNIIGSIINYNLCLENQIQLNFSNCKLGKILTNVIDNFTFDLQLKQIHIQLDCNMAQDYQVYTDQDIIEQVLTNILANSIKHSSQERQPTIQISMYKEHKALPDPLASSKASDHLGKKATIYSQLNLELEEPIVEYIIIKIKDNGAGICKDKLQELEKILRNDSYQNKKHGKSEGCFLGLRSCNQLLQKLNHSDRHPIDIKSIEYEGTEVSIRIKLPPQQLQLTRKDSNQGIHKVKHFQTMKHMAYHTRENICLCDQTVLIVDDEPFNLIILEAILKELGFNARKASNGYEALQAYIVQSKVCLDRGCPKFKAILMDYQMPIMDGQQATRAILSECLTRNCRPVSIIGCTAFSAQEDIQELTNAGMVTVCIKPLNKSKLKEALQQAQLSSHRN